MRHECVKPIAELAARYVRTSEEQGTDMTVYAVVQLKITDRAAYDRYQARFLATANSPEHLEISKDRKAGTQGIVLQAIRIGT